MANIITDIDLGRSVKYLYTNSRSFIQIVEKLWESLWVSLWETCGKVLHMVEIWEFSTENIVKVGVFHDVVEKFYRGIYTGFNRGKSGVLHSFHSPYYYYY